MNKKMTDEESQETGNVGRNSGETGGRRRERGEGRGMRAEVRKNSGNGGKRGQMKKKKGMLDEEKVSGLDHFNIRKTCKARNRIVSSSLKTILA